MKNEHPQPRQIPQLRQLWKDVFGDEDAFLDRFFSVAYAPERCLCALEGETVTGMLYWLPCGAYAYLYAVATHPDHRGKGICRSLMTQAHHCMARQGFQGVLLYPQEEGLRKMYQKMGYTHQLRIRELSCRSGGTPVPLTQISASEYFTLRPGLLPPGSVIQDSPFRELTEALRFYKGQGLLLAAENRGDTLFAQELLGDPEQASGILAALEKKQGTFRCPGSEQPFSMYRPLAANGAVPRYFAFPLD